MNTERQLHFAPERLVLAYSYWYLYFPRVQVPVQVRHTTKLVRVLSITTSTSSTCKNVDYSEACCFWY
jgi:hypothetical protein